MTIRWPERWAGAPPTVIARPSAGGRGDLGGRRRNGVGACPGRGQGALGHHGPGRVATGLPVRLGGSPRRAWLLRRTALLAMTDGAPTKPPITQLHPMRKGGWVYLMSNKKDGVLYTGMTSALYARVVQHKTNHFPKSFTARYNAHLLVWYEFHPTVQEAIAREKQVKAGNRKRKEALINAMNPEWRDLFEDLDPGMGLPLG